MAVWNIAAALNRVVLASLVSAAINGHTYHLWIPQGHSKFICPREGRVLQSEPVITPEAMTKFNCHLRPRSLLTRTPV
jgi:hypothetical protein